MSDPVMATKSLTTVKADGDTGLVVAKFSHFGNVDSDGDVMLPGSFKDSFENNSRLPVYAQHNMNPADAIGHTVKLWEGDDGAYAEMQFWLEFPEGEKVYKGIKEGVFEWSYGLQYGVIEPNEHGGFNVHSLAVHEVSSVHRGANALTETVSAKSDRNPEDRTGGNGEDGNHRARLALGIQQVRLGL